MNIGKSKTVDYIQIAELHRKYINTGFLSSLGLSFLKLIYKSITSSKYAFCLVAEENEETIGFVSGTISVGAFYKEFFKRNIFKASLILIPKVLRPKIFKKIFETILYPVKKDNDLPKAELLSIVVNETYRGKGISQKLFNKLMEEFKKDGIDKFKVVVGSNFLPACRFYEKMGGVLHSEIEVHKGEKSRVYVWKI